MDPVSLTDGGLLLRPPRPADAAAVLAACQDPDIARWTTIPAPYTAQDARTWVEVEAVRGWDTDSHLVWYGCDPAEPEVPLVSVGLHHLDLAEHAGEIGYWAVPAARGRGLTTAAVVLVCRFAFERLGLERIDWQAAVGNDASRRVAEKAGFVIEATTRGRLVLRGSAEDSWFGGLLPADQVPHAPVTVVPVPPLRPAPDGADPAPSPGPTPIRGVEITAGALHLRPWRSEDVPLVVGLLDDPEIAQWNAFTRAGTAAEDAQRFVARAADDDGTRVGFAVTDATTGEVLGHVALHHLDLDAGLAELGYWTVPAARGRGVATRAVATTARWAFGALGLTRVELFHARGNDASCRVAERAGFAHEGTLRRSFRYGDGLRHDEHLHARLASDPPA